MNVLRKLDAFHNSVGAAYKLAVIKPARKYMSFIQGDKEVCPLAVSHLLCVGGYSGAFSGNVRHCHRYRLPAGINVRIRRKRRFFDYSVRARQRLVVLGLYPARKGISFFLRRSQFDACVVSRLFRVITCVTLRHMQIYVYHNGRPLRFKSKIFRCVYFAVKHLAFTRFMPADKVIAGPGGRGKIDGIIKIRRRCRKFRTAVAAV